MLEALRQFDFPTPPRPASIEIELRGALAAAKIYVSQGETIPADVMTPRIRAMMRARSQALEAAMRPGSKEEIARVWSTMVDMRGGFKPSDVEQARDLASRRADDLKSAPLWAVCEAVAAFRCGHIGAGSTKPPVGLVGKEARFRAEPFESELASLRMVLSARVAPETTAESLARKKSLAARMRELAAGLGTDAPTKAAKSQGDRQSAP